MALLDSIPDVFPSGVGASAWDFAASGHGHLPPFLEAHMWLIPAGLALASFLAAATRPAYVPGSGRLPRPVNIVVWGTVGVGCLVLTAFFVHRTGW